LAEVLAKSHVGGGVRTQVRGAWRSIAVGEPRGIVNVGRDEGSPWQVPVSSEMQGVALVMVQQKVSCAAVVRTNQAACNSAETLCKLVGVGEVHLAAVGNARRAQRQLPGIDARSLNIHREKDVGVIEVAVVEVVFGAREKGVGVEHPAMKWNG